MLLRLKEDILQDLVTTMPGYRVLDSQLQEDTENVAKYRCPQCHLLLRDAVQPSCGHWLCSDCAVEIFAKKNPRCPRDDCGEELVPEDGQDFFPDRFVRREILQIVVICAFQSLGCTWEGPLSDYEAHKNGCTYAVEKCECGDTMPRTELALHKKTKCPKSKKHCPLSKLGCPGKQEMTHKELCDHFGDTTNLIDHFELLAAYIRSLRLETTLTDSALPLSTKRPPAVGSDHFDKFDSGIKSLSVARRFADEEKDGVEKDNPTRPQKLKLLDKDLPAMPGVDLTRLALYSADTLGPGAPIPKWFQDEIEKVRKEARKESQQEQDTLRDRIKVLEQQMTQMQKTLQAKNSEIEDRDFRLSLIENSNYDGTMIWKIPQFSQRMTDAKTGKYTSIFSLPFYSSRYGYKMCLRLYIMGDGIGKGSHMSLFFVMMRGEFDNILQWPFTQRVTFRLINQGNGGRDIVDTFQPDPLSSSFKKPKSDMNIASGCPRFISHENLKGGGYIADDTIFIKCTVGQGSLSHP